MSQRVAIYCRVSTERQGEKGNSLGEQDFLCTQYALNKGYIVVERVFEEISGTTYDRPKMDYVIELAKTKKIDLIICLELDRLGRGTMPVMMIDQQLKQQGVQVEYVLNNFEKGADGDMMKTIMAAFAERERLKIRERLIRGKDGKARKNLVVQAGSPAYGYDFVNNHYVINESEASIVRMIFDWYVYGNKGLVAIAKSLTEMGVPTRRDLQGITRKRRIGTWGASSVQIILKNQTYIGKLAWGKTRVDVDTAKQVKMPEKDWIFVDVPVIISEEIFQKAQRQAERNTTNSTRNRQNQYLLAGMLYCAHCGLKFVGASTAKPKRGWKGKLYYRCGNQISANKSYDSYREPCPRKHLEAAVIDESVWEMIAEVLQHPEYVTQSLLERRDTDASSLQQQRIDIIKKELGKLEGQEKKILDLFLSDAVDHSLLKSKSEEIKTAKASLEKELVTLQGNVQSQQLTDANIAEIETYCRGIAAGLELFDFEERRDVLKALQIKVYVDRSTEPPSITVDGLVRIASTSFYSTGSNSRCGVSFTITRKLRAAA